MIFTQMCNIIIAPTNLLRIRILWFYCIMVLRKCQQFFTGLRKIVVVHIERLLNMVELYKRIESLCTHKGVTITKMCKESGASRASLTDLKKGRKQGLSADTLAKIATYFNVSVDFLLGVEIKKAPTLTDERQVSDEDIKFALFGGDGEITDAMYDEVKRFAKMVKLREEAEREKK